MFDSTLSANLSLYFDRFAVQFLSRITVKAHPAFNKAMDLCYRPQAFGSELERIEYLFELYEQYTAPMFGGEEGKKEEIKITVSQP